MARAPRYKASTNKASTWATFEEALAAAKYADGIGFVLTDTYIAALDLDHCRNAESGEILPWVSDLIDRAQSYTEVTPSREGIRIIGRANGPKLPDTKLDINDEGATCEFYRGAIRYITITGDQIGDNPINNIDAVMDAAYAELEKRKREKSSSAADDGPPYGEDEDGEEGLEQLIHTRLPKGQRSDKVVFKATCWMLRDGYVRSAILSTLLDKENGISEHIYDQDKPREYALRQIVQAEKAVGSDTHLKIRSIEIRPGQVETFKVSIGDGNVVVDAEALNRFDWFNRACISQIRRSFPMMRRKAWSNEVDRALRAAREPVQLTEEQPRRHGTDSWKNEPVAWLVRERIPQIGIGLLSGMYSTFKSFVLLDLSGSVMTGLPFIKARTIRRGGVLIFAAEGASSLPMRLKALIEHRLGKEIEEPGLFERSKIDLGRLPFSYVAHCRPLLDPKTVEWMVAKAQEEQAYFQNAFGCDLVLIGIDTMSAAAGWDNENDAAQAQIVMNHLGDVSKATGAFVLAADHFGKDVSAGTRGSVVKEASADTTLAVLGERDKETNTMDDTRVVIHKQRDGPQGELFPFHARLVDMGEDRDGEPLTSRVIDWNVERVEKVKEEKKTEAQLVMERALAQGLETIPERIFVNGVEIVAVREERLRPIFSELYQQSKPGVSANAIRQARFSAFERIGNGIAKHTVDGVLYLCFPPAPF